MNAFEVSGGKRLKGEIIPQGAKNEALQIISAVLLLRKKSPFQNIPDILDVNLLIELLSEMGVKMERPSRDTCIFQADDVNMDYLQQRNLSKKKRAGYAAPLCWQVPCLPDFRKAFVPKPGGDKIGRRRLDTHMIGFEKLGARFSIPSGRWIFSS